MIDITSKTPCYRVAEAYGRIRLRRKTIELIRSGKVEKGDPLITASIAGILAAKRTPEIIPLCHPIPLTKVDVVCWVDDDEHVACKSMVKTIAQTGVEMEALVAVSTALLTVWDMVKAYEKDEQGQYPTTVISDIKVVSKIKKSLE